MEPHGFIQDMLDVKVLILFVMSRVMYPVDEQKIYELCYQDDRLSYFDVRIAIPQMVETGHLEQLPSGLYSITEKGKEACEVTEDSIAYPVMQRAAAAVAEFNSNVRRDSFIKTQIEPRESGDYSVVMALDDELGNLLKLEMMAPSRRQAMKIADSFTKNADAVYQSVMALLVDEAEQKSGI